MNNVLSNFIGTNSIESSELNTSQIGDSDSFAVQEDSVPHAVPHAMDVRQQARYINGPQELKSGTDLETETSDYLYSTEASVGDGRRPRGDVVRRSDDEYSAGYMRQDRGAAPRTSDGADGGKRGRWGRGGAEEEEGPVRLEEFMALLRDKGVLGGVVTEAEALDAFGRHATQPGGHDAVRQLGVAGCKRAVKELLESKDMLSRHRTLAT